jgi:hypothetical protein
MRAILGFIHLNSLSHQPRLRMRLLGSARIGLLGLVVAAVAIFASSGKARIEQTPAAPMPNMRGEAATEYLKQQGLYSSLGEAMKVARYRVYPSSPREGEKRGEAFYADNPGQRLRAGFTPDGLILRGGSESGAGWEFGMRLRSAGYGARQMAVSAGRLSAKGARIEYERTVGIADCGLRIADLIPPSSIRASERYDLRNPRSAIVEWYVNKVEGLEQGFTLAAPVAERQGEEPLVLRLELTGELRARAEADGQSVTLLRKAGLRALDYDHLSVVDARGRKLAAHLEAADSDVRIVVDDRGASYPVTIDPTFVEIKKLTPSDGGVGKLFGGSVAIYGDTAIVGASIDSIGNNNKQGSAYIFERNQGGPGNWGEVKKLIASDGATDNLFGASVAIYGDTAIVGAPGEVTSVSYPGSAYIFGRNQGGANNWGEVKKLTASDGDGNDFFGCSVAIYANTAIVGAEGAGEPFNIRLGAAYIFERNQGGANNWGEVKKLTASDAAELDFFGGSVAIYADTAIVGAEGDDIDILNGPFHHQGSAYIFERNHGGANNWGEVKKLIASDGEADDSFGISVAIYADTAIIGALNDFIGSNSFQGSAYIFERNQGGANNWGEVKKLTASDGDALDQFGGSVAIYGDTAIVGAAIDFIGSNFQQGSAYIFERNQGGADNWGEVKKLTASDGGLMDNFGRSVAIYADTAIVGAYQDNSAYIFAENSPPTISAAPVTRVEGAPTSNSTIATVSDPDQAANTLAVTVNGSTSATVNGVTISNITVSASGEVKADVGAACGASNAGFTLRVTDSGGLFAEDTLDVTVTPETVPPTIKLLPSIQLWPPDHTYHTVTMAQMVESVSDNCSSLSIGDVVIEKVTSDEPDNALGDGNTINDIVIAPDCRSVQLRAERAGTGDGRVYTITLRLKDSNGNVTQQDFEVSVPHSQNGVPAMKGAAALTVTSGCQ